MGPHQVYIVFESPGLTIFKEILVHLLVLFPLFHFACGSFWRESVSSYSTGYV